jgi:hypothetical protein
MNVSDPLKRQGIRQTDILWKGFPNRHTSLLIMLAQKSSEDVDFYGCPLVIGVGIATHKDIDICLGTNRVDKSG